VNKCLIIFQRTTFRAFQRSVSGHTKLQITRKHGN